MMAAKKRPAASGGDDGLKKRPASWDSWATMSQADALESDEDYSDGATDTSSVTPQQRWVFKKAPHVIGRYLGDTVGGGSPHDIRTYPQGYIPTPHRARNISI